MQDHECLFCTIWRERRGIVYENEYFYAQFDAFPVSPGHLEVIPKRHVVSLLDLHPKEWAALQSALAEAVGVIENTDLAALYQRMLDAPLNEKSAWYCQQALHSGNANKKPDGYNFGNNDGEAAGRTIHHLHIHIIPRYYGDLPAARGGIRGIIPHLRDYRA